MRIAIVGAGIAGLACAHELERLGVVCDVFEKRDRIGKMFRTVETMLQPLSMEPHRDIFTLLRGECQLPVNPANHIVRTVMHTRNREATLNGGLGYTTIRGYEERSLEMQLHRHITAEVQFDQDVDVRALMKSYDWVVLAAGSPAWPKQFGLWTKDICWWVAGANVKGDFNPAELHFFFDTRFAGTGYAMISPFDERIASVGVGVPESHAEELKMYWERFRTVRGRFWEVEVETFWLECFEMGRVRQRVVENLILVGNAGGFAEPLGITGQLPSMRSGVYAARKLVLGDDSFDTFAGQWDRYYESLLRIRHNINAWTDKEMDRLAAFAGHGVGSFFAHSPWNLLNPAGQVMDYLPVAKDQSPAPGPQ